MYLPLSGGTFLGDVTVDSTHFTLKDGSPEFYLHTEGDHYNWLVAAQENVDGGFEIGHSSATATALDQDASNYTRALTLHPTTGATFAGTITSGNITINGSSRALVVKSSNDQVVSSFVCDGNAISTIGFKGNTGSNDYNVRIGADGSSLVAYTVNTVRMTIDSSGDATFSGNVTCGNLHASSFTDVITNSILTASGDLDIKTVTTGRDVRFRSGSNAVQLRVKGDATGILINDHANLRGVATTSATATTIVATVAHALYSGIFFDFVIKNGTNVRAGTLTVCHDGTTVEYAETSTVDLGDTSDVTLSSNISGTAIRLIATSTSSTWTIKSLIRAI